MSWYWSHWTRFCFCHGLVQQIPMIEHFGFVIRNFALISGSLKKKSFLYWSNSVCNDHHDWAKNGFSNSYLFVTQNSIADSKRKVVYVLWTAGPSWFQVSVSHYGKPLPIFIFRSESWWTWNWSIGRSNIPNCIEYSRNCYVWCVKTFSFWRLSRRIVHFSTKVISNFYFKHRKER